MANYSIPSWTPAIGRTSTPLSRRSRKPNSASASFFEAFSLTTTVQTQASSSFNVQRLSSNAQRVIQTVRRWMSCVERWPFSIFWRVKGAWWSSRSSKPSSPRKWRGRFDSYPLRLSSLVILRGAKRSREIAWPYREAIHRDSSTETALSEAEGLGMTRIERR